MAKEFDREGLQAFVDQDEGESPPVFVGRKDIIQDILRTANRAYQPDALRHGKPKATRVIHGAPGAGKSSILAELETRCMAEAAESENAPRMVIVDSEHLESNLPRVLAAISVAGRTEHREWLRLLEPIRKPAQESADRIGRVAGFGFSLDLSHLFSGRPHADLPDLANRQRPSEWHHPVIVAVDEAQNLPPDKHSPHGVFLRHVHNAKTGLPLTLVLAGLGDTFERAGEVGLTRGLRLHEVGCLSEKNCRVLTKRFCERYGISGYTDSQLAEFARPTEGWPRHLHFALQALGKAALALDGDLTRAKWNDVALQAAESRLGYYNGQWSIQMQSSDGLVAAVMSGLRDNMRTSNINRLIERSVADETGMRLPKGMDAEMFRQHLVHQGALEQRRDKTYHCPIPSNRTFLMMKGDLKAAQMMASEAARHRSGGRRLSQSIERS